MATSGLQLQERARSFLLARVAEACIVIALRNEVHVLSLEPSSQLAVIRIAIIGLQISGSRTAIDESDKSSYDE